jgi:hypothetical protein
MMCLPRENKGMLCERALYLLRSLNSKNDALLLQVTLLKVDADNEQLDTISEKPSKTLRLQALLYSGASGCGILSLMEDFSHQEEAPLSKNINRTSARTFNMAMMEKSLSAIGAFVDQQISRHQPKIPYCLEEMPVTVADSFKLPQDVVAKGDGSK